LNAPEEERGQGCRRPAPESERSELGLSSPRRTADPDRSRSQLLTLLAPSHIFLGGQPSFPHLTPARPAPSLLPTPVRQAPAPRLKRTTVLSKGTWGGHFQAAPFKDFSLKKFFWFFFSPFLKKKIIYI